MMSLIRILLDFITVARRSTSTCTPSYIIDLRDSLSFCSQHIAYSTNIPWSGWQDRSCELPPPGSLLHFIIDNTDTDIAAEIHAELARDWLSSRYTVGEIWDPTPEFWTSIMSLDDSAVIMNCSCSRVAWSPSTTLSEVIGRIELALVDMRDNIRKSYQTMQLRRFNRLVKPCTMHGFGDEFADLKDDEHEETEECFAVLDLGCGAGRDCIYLAKRKLWGPVVGVDNLPRIVKRLHSLAEHNNVVDRVKGVCAELEPLPAASTTQLPPAMADQLAASLCAHVACENYLSTDIAPPISPYALVHCCRYLYRPILPIIRDSIVAPGGFFIVSHFLSGAAAFGKPKRPCRLLQSGELRTIFADWDIWMDEERTLPEPDGRPVAAFVARKPL